MKDQGNGEWGQRAGSMVHVLHGLKIRIGATLSLLVGGFVGIILYLAFWAGRFTWYQDVAVVLSVILIVPLSVILLWISWGLGMRRRMTDWFDSVDRFD